MSCVRGVVNILISDRNVKCIPLQVAKREEKNLIQYYVCYLYGHVVLVILAENT